MDVLYCGDANIIDGLIISILSLIKHTNCNLNIYILTMNYKTKDKTYKPITKNIIGKLEKRFKKIRKNINIKVLNITDIVNTCPPLANIDSRFTPYCMLRLYADMIPDLPNKILYLDNDVVALNDPMDFYNLNLDKYDIAGVLDRYGSYLLNVKAYKKDYLNSGVLLLNLDNIRKNKVFAKSRIQCQKIKMLMPDQTAINIFAKNKLIVNEKFNDQVSIKQNTVFRHYTTTFKLMPKFHTQKVKPWEITKMHKVLNDYALDNLLNEYLEIKEEVMTK